MQLFENPAREAHIRQALNCSLEHTVIAAVNEYLRWYEKREAALSQAKEAQWVEELAKTQSQRPSLPANATPVAASPLVPAQPRPISQPVLLPQTQTNLPLNPATSSGSLRGRFEHCRMRATHPCTHPPRCCFSNRCHNHSHQPTNLRPFPILSNNRLS